MLKHYSVVLNNDDDCPYSEITKALKVIFNMTEAEAGEVAIHVHSKGRKVIERIHSEKRELREEQIRTWYTKGNHKLPITFEEIL
jgi:ATP-dependent Clp protease adapter protein ClpS